MANRAEPRTSGRVLAFVLVLTVAIGTVAGCSLRPSASTDPSVRTFGDVMRPLSTKPWTPTDLQVDSGATPPAWPDVVRTRWDAKGAFTPSAQPRPAGTVISTLPRPDDAAIFPGFGGSLFNGDVSFTITARHFAIATLGNRDTDAMVWVDSRPVATKPILGSGPADSTTPNWISVTLPKRKTVDVRVAGPLVFVGVDTPAGESAVVKATKPRLTLGVLADSEYTYCADRRCMAGAAGPTLAGLTGFRVWNLSERGTGYVNPGEGGKANPGTFGSERRLAALAQAPIDALMIGGSINDAFVPLKGYHDAVDQLLTTLAKTRPNLPVVILGIEPLPGSMQTTYWRARCAVMTSVLRSMAKRHKNVVGLIDPYTENWFTGSGSIAAPKGDGNADRFLGLDGIHPSVAGVRHFQGRVTAALRTLPFPAAPASPPSADAG